MRPASQLGEEREARSHSPTIGDHREGAPSQAPSLYKELAGLGRQSFPLLCDHSSSSST